MDFEQIDSIATTIANGLFCDIETKKDAKRNMIDMVALACKAYTIDNDFKKEIDDYIKYRQLEMKYR